MQIHMFISFLHHLYHTKNRHPCAPLSLHDQSSHAFILFKKNKLPTKNKFTFFLKKETIRVNLRKKKEIVSNRGNLKWQPFGDYNYVLVFNKGHFGY
ncbi:hypothetical protein ACJX0J_038351, partial [Zea mays]